MLGIGSVFTVGRGGTVTEIADAQGTECIGVFGRSPAVATLANGIKPLSATAIPPSLNEIAKGMTVVSLAEGKNHGLACTSLGAVYVWGDNSFGQLGLRASTLPGGFADEPQLQAFLERQTIRKVAAGDQHSVALTEDYGVYAWGDNMAGQCGSSGGASASAASANKEELVAPAKEDLRLPFPRFVSGLHSVRVKEIAAGSRFTVCLSIEGAVYSFGEGLFGQLGIGRTATCSARALKVTIDARKAFFDRPEETHVVLAGRAHQHSHGGANSSNSISQAQLEGISTSIVEISAGEGHVLARSSSGHVYSWGFNGKGQLGLGDLTSRHTPVLVQHKAEDFLKQKQRQRHRGLFRASCVSAGRFHSAAVEALTGRVYTWGAALLGDLRALKDGHHSIKQASLPAAAAAGVDSSSYAEAAMAGPSEASKWPLPGVGVGPLSQQWSGSARDRRRMNGEGKDGGEDGGTAAAAGHHASSNPNPNPLIAREQRRRRIEAGTFQIKTVPNAAHVQLKRKQREFAVLKATAEATGVLQPPMPSGALIVTKEDGASSSSSSSSSLIRHITPGAAYHAAASSVNAQEAVAAAQQQQLALAAAGGSSPESGELASLMPPPTTVKETLAKLGADARGLLFTTQSSSSSPAAAGEGAIDEAYGDEEDGENNGGGGGSAFDSHSNTVLAHASALKPSGTRSNSDLHALASIAGLRLRDIGVGANRVMGAPWCRQPLPLVDTADGPCFALPTRLKTPFLQGQGASEEGQAPNSDDDEEEEEEEDEQLDEEEDGEEANTTNGNHANAAAEGKEGKQGRRGARRFRVRAAAVSCGDTTTTVFVPSVLSSVFPPVALDTGGKLLTLQGQALSSICRLGASYRELDDAASNNPFLGGAGSPNPNPNADLCAQARQSAPDATGLVPIPGLVVCFRLKDKQPGKRPDDPPEFSAEDDSSNGNNAGEGEQHQHANKNKGGEGGGNASSSSSSSSSSAPLTIYAKGYYPNGWETDPNRDVPGLANDSFAVIKKESLGGEVSYEGAHVQQQRRNSDDVNSSIVSVPGGIKSSLPSLDSIIVVAPPVPKPCAVEVSLIVKPPRPLVSSVSDTAASLPMPLGSYSSPLPSATTTTSAGTATAATQSMSMKRRAQVIAGTTPLSFITLPILNKSSPAMIKLEPQQQEQQEQQEAASAVTTTTEAGEGKEAEEAAAPSASSSSSSAPPSGGSSSSAGGPVVTLSGEHLFGVALVDEKSSPTAESLIDLVKAAVAAREREEAFLLVSDVGLPPRSATVPSSSSSSLAAPASSKGKGGQGGTGTGGSVSLEQEEERIDLLLPTLHIQRSGGGGPQRPHNVLVRFAVFASPPPASATGGVATAPRLIGHSEAVRGWFNCRYDEHLVHVGKAIDRMTGTSKAATKNAATTAGGSTASGLAGGGGGGTSSFYGGTAASGVGTSRFGGGGSATKSAAASGFFGGGAGSGTGSGMKTSNADQEEDENEDDDDDAEDDEGVIGRYSASISCAVPDVTKLVSSSSSSSSSSASSSSPSGPLVSVPEAISQLYKQLVDGTVSVKTLGLAGAAAPEGSSDEAVAAAKAFNYPQEFSLAVAARAASAAGGTLLLRPEISVNGGADFVAGAPSSIITAFNPQFSFVTPPCAPVAMPAPAPGPGAANGDSGAAAEGSSSPLLPPLPKPVELRIRGTGFVDAPSILVQFRGPMPPASTASTAAADNSNSSTEALEGLPVAATAKASFIDSTTLKVLVPDTLPPFAQQQQQQDAAGGGGGGIVGHQSYSIFVSMDGGGSFSTAPDMLFVAYRGDLLLLRAQAAAAAAASAAPAPLVLVPMVASGQRTTLKLPLTKRSTTMPSPSFDAWTRKASSASFVPPVALLGHPFHGALGTGVALSLKHTPSADDVAAAAAASGDAAALASALPKWSAPLLPVYAAEGAGEEDLLEVSVPSFADFAAAAAGPTPSTAAAAAADAAASPVAAPLVFTPNLRVATAEVSILGRPLPTKLSLRFFDPSSLSITSVGPPKKIALGGEITVTLEGLEALLAGKDGMKAPAAAAASAGAPPAAKGGKPDPKAAAAAAAPVELTAAEKALLAPVPLEGLGLRIKIVGGGLTAVLTATKGAEPGLLTAQLPSDAATPSGDVTVEASIDGGKTFTSPPVPAKIAKK